MTEEDDLLHDSEVEHWLPAVVVPIAEQTLADPSRSVSAEEVRAHFAAKRAGRAWATESSPSETGNGT